MKIVVDTSLLIDFTRKKKIDKENLLWANLVKYSKERGHQLIVPPVVVFEFFSGEEMSKLENQKKAEDVLRDTVLVNFDSETAKGAAALLRNNKIRVGTIDYFIAATAVSVDGELATLNPKHFEIFKDLKLFNFKKLDKA